MEPSIYKAPGPFVLETGHTLPELRIAYHTYGKPNAAHDNVVWVCHALTANSDVADWWPHTVEAGCFLDPARHFVVCANILGSHYGTTGPLHVNPETGSPYYKDFPPFTIRDIVRAHRLLAGALGIGRIDTLVGSSVGGFQAIEWAVLEPERIGKLILIATAAKASSTLCTTSTPSAAKLSSRVSTILRRFLSGRPPGKLRSVLRPIMTGQPLVHATKWRISERLDTTMSPSQPMPQSSHTATIADSLHVMSTTYTAMGMFLTCGPCS